jgi:hypothetical protein
MPRRPSFRRDTQLQNEVRRINKLVQNKQSRIRTQTGLEVEGVDTTKYKNFSSRKEINRYLNDMSQFLDRQADFNVQNQKGVSLNYSDIKEVEKEIKRINKRKEEEFDKFKDLPFKHRGVPTGLTVEQQANPVIGMGDIKFADLRKKQFNPHRFESQKQLEKYKEGLFQTHQGDFTRKRNELYKENYLKALHNEFGWEGRHLYEHISSMPLDEFIKLYYTENNANILFVYDEFSRKVRIKELESVWGLTG